jgi:hypothetical protein
MGFSQGALALQIKCDIQDSLDLLLAKIKVADEIPTLKSVCILSS